MSNKVSVIIPARNESLLIQTVESVLGNARGDCEAVVILQEYPPAGPVGYDALVAKYPNLHTITHNVVKGMRQAINDGVASAVSRGAKYVAKFDAHCCFPEGWDTALKAECDSDWVVVPRRKRLDPDTFAPRNDGRPDIDYHYLSFPDNVNDFGGPGLNGKVWAERAKERLEIELDDEMSSQGSGWFMHADYFYHLDLMDAASYGTFWNEFQEIGLKCWLSGGRVKVNKRTWYAHLHKGSNYKGADGKGGRGYHLEKQLLNQGATYTKRWLFNDAWKGQTKPFKTLIEHFWPVPTWPENWEELVYGQGNQDRVVVAGSSTVALGGSAGLLDTSTGPVSLLTIHSAVYGIGSPDDLDVTQVLKDTIVNNSLDISVTNDALKVGNPFRGQKKRLVVTYSYNGDSQVTMTKDEREWLIIGQSARYVRQPVRLDVVPDASVAELIQHLTPAAGVVGHPQREAVVVEAEGAPSATALPTIKHSPLVDAPIIKTLGRESFTADAPQSVALIDKLIRRFQIPSHRLRGPMPIEVPTFHRNDLAQLFAELGFNRGAEIGVAEGNYSEVLVKANPNLELLCVDPWHAYSGNKQQKSKEKHEYAFNEASRKLAGSKAQLIMQTSVDAVRNVADGELDFVYIDGNHSFDFVLLDLILWIPKVRPGGLITGDDYYYLDPKRWGAGPVEAVQAYTQAHKISPWFTFQGHKSIDFMWVKQ